MKRNKNKIFFVILERGFEPQIFSNFPAHGLNFRASLRSNNQNKLLKEIELCLILYIPYLNVQSGNAYLQRRASAADLQGSAILQICNFCDFAISNFFDFAICNFCNFAICNFCDFAIWNFWLYLILYIPYLNVQSGNAYLQRRASAADLQGSAILRINSSCKFWAICSFSQPPELSCDMLNQTRPRPCK